MIGSGIFRVPSAIAADAGSVAAVLAVWAAAGLISLFGALCYAELAGLFPRAGGEYVFLREGLGSPVAFLFGWTFLLVSPAGWAAVALIFASYFGTFLASTESQTRIIAAALILVISAVHYRSVRFGASVQTIATSAKLLALIVLALAVFWFGDPSAGSFSGAEPSAVATWGSVGLAMIAALFAYDGWQTVTGMAGEVRNPSRNLPVALIGGTALVLFVYLLVNTAYLYALPLEALAASELVAVDAVRQATGAAGGSLIAALVMLSTFGALNALLMANPRIFYAMAQDGLFFRSLAKVHPRFEAPHVAIAFSAAIAILYVSIRTFEELAEAFIVGFWPFAMLQVAALIALRKKRPDLPRPYRTFGYPWLPLAFLAASGGLVVNTLVEHPWTTLLSFAVTLAGLPLFFLWKMVASRRGADRPAR
ncbi:MAG: amino acid permease [Pseudomonadota bacterium]|nr:amino acid permease [Pseudomonadota bacterium]